MRIRLVLLALLWMSPALAAEPPSFTLYFGLGSAVPTTAARAVIARAAEAARQRQRDGSFDHVKVIGYADTSGSDQRSQALSEARAEAIRQVLAGHGLAPDRIATEGRGKKSLAVPTANHVVEPRNRRARIVVYGPGE